MTLPTPARLARALRRHPIHLAAAMAAGAAAAVVGFGPRPCSHAGDDEAPGMLCVHSSGASLDAALDRFCAGEADPCGKRGELLSLLRRSSMCFSSKMTPAQYDIIFHRLQALPPGLVAPDGERYFTDTTVWTGNGTLGSSNRALAANLTYSFPADGTSWDGGANTLNARFTTVFGAANIDKGRELVRQAFASWRRSSGITYTESADDNTSMTGSTTHSTLRGDCRVGARPQDGVNGVLAYDYFPTGGADMVLDADDFSGNFNSSSQNYLFLRNTVAHEHGHGLGFIHSVPCNNTKLMEPFEPQPFDSVQVDETRGAQRNYGDRFVGNNSAVNAANFGDLTSPVLHSVIEKDLSTNGTAGFNNSDEDWFKFTTSSVQNIVITAHPTGGTYTEGSQTSGCSGSLASVVASQAGNLAVELRDSTGASVILSSSGAAAGVDEIVTANALAAGTYTVRIVDGGANPTANQFVQLYDLTIRVGTAKALPQAIAGVNKRVAANTTCFFMGNIMSRVTEAGASISTYAWDLDGDGTYEIANTAQPTRTYITNGVYSVSLKVTDSNGMSDTDTIFVTVFGGAAGGISLASVSPNNGVQGVTVPVTLNGTGLINVDQSTDVSVSGTGVTVTGTPVPNGGGTQVTGLSFIIAAGATLGAHDVTVTTVDGTSTLTGGFTVNTNNIPAVNSMSPIFIRQGFTVPITINGSNFTGVTTASQVTTSGTGVQAIGTPVVGGGGTTITGLSLQVDLNAASSQLYRSLSVTTAGGTGTLNLAFRVRCLADWDGDAQITPSDVASFINNWSTDLTAGTLNADVDHDGSITPSDVAVFVNVWFTSLSSGCV